MTKCEYYADRECIETDECESMFVSCDECECIDSEGYCDNKNGGSFLDFVDGLAVCCKQFEKLKE